MEIVIDGGLLSKLANANALPPINELFGEPHWVIAPSAMKEMRNVRGKYSHIELLLSYYPISTKKLLKKDRFFIAKKRKRKYMLSKQEIEAIAIAKNRGLMYVTNERAAREACREYGVNYFTLPMLLKALWAKQIRTKRQVWDIVNRLEKEEPLKFTRMGQIMGEE